MVDPCCRVHEKKMTDKLEKKRHPKFKFSSHTKGCLGCWFSLCTLQGAHISQLTIQLNNECEGRIGSTLAKSLFFHLGSVRRGQGKVWEGGLDHRCRDSLAGGIRERVALHYQCSTWHRGLSSAQTSSAKQLPLMLKRAGVKIPSLLNIKRFQLIFLSIHLDVSLFSRFDLLTFLSIHL